MPKAIPLKEVQNLWTGTFGMGALILGALAVTFWEKQPTFIFEYRFAIVGLFAFSMMAVHELFIVRIYKRNFNFSSPRILNDANYTNLKTKFLALVCSLLLAFFAYTLLNEYGLNLRWDTFLQYNQSWYKSFFNLFFILTPTFFKQDANPEIGAKKKN